MVESEKSKIWVISLADADERRAQFAASVPAGAPAWEFFDAHTGLAPALSHDSGAARATHGRTLCNGELGCYSSHYALWQWLRESDCQQMIVLEDDVQIDWGFVRFMIDQDFDELSIPYLRLFAKLPSRSRYVASPFIDRYHHLIRFTSYALGTQAYLLTRTGAERLLRHAQQVRYPVDVYMDRYWDHGVTNLAIYPFPVIERFQPSSIGAARFDTEALPLAASLQFKMSEFFNKARMWKDYCFSSDVTRGLQQKLQGRFSG